MYCKKCGKFFYGDAEMCPECLAEEKILTSEPSVEGSDTATTVPSTPTEEPKQTVKVSLGKAITAAVLSNVGLIFVYIGLIIMEMFLESGYGDYVAGVVITLIGVVPCILGLIFGIKSISYYKSLSNVKSGKKIPVLVLGIVSTATSGVGLFCAVIVLLAVLVL